jgi:hypothetical protein
MTPTLLSVDNPPGHFTATLLVHRASAVISITIFVFIGRRPGKGRFESRLNAAKTNRVTGPAILQLLQPAVKVADALIT